MYIRVFRPSEVTPEEAESHMEATNFQIADAELTSDDSHVKENIIPIEWITNDSETQESEMEKVEEKPIAHTSSCNCESDDLDMFFESI